jgi:predicted DNA binding CopG/RHH family protein
LRRIDITVPAKLVEGVRRFALEHGMSQQQLLRYLLFKYLAAAPWEQAETVSVEVAR